MKYKKVYKQGIIRYILHHYCFSLKYHYLKNSRDVTCTLLSLLPLFVYFFTAIPTSPMSFIQLYFMLIEKLGWHGRAKKYTNKNSRDSRQGVFLS